MEYAEFLEKIYLRHSTNVKLGLERMHTLLERLGNPNMRLRGIHVAGTNGKGSTCAFLESLLLAHGHKVGLNTSPHLIDYTERIRVNGVNITSDELMALYHQHEHVFEECEASFFEITTTLAFLYFVEKAVDTSIFEVGLGGRLDGTNPFNSTVTCITSISLDHPKSLGDTLEKIAYEKAGIIKPAVPVVVGAIAPEPLRVITTQAEAQKAPLYLLGKDFTVSNVAISPQFTSFDYSFPKFDIKLQQLKVNLLGEHQVNNAAIALTAFILYLRSLSKNEWSVGKGLAPSVSIPHQALQNANWIGRMQVFSQSPLVIVDGAHNEEGVEALVHNIKTLYPNHKYHFLVSILRDKKLDKMIEKICTIAHWVYICQNPSERAADVQEQVEVVARCGVPYFTEGNITTSFHTILSRMHPTQDMIIVTGSLYTISEILKIDPASIKK